MRAGSETVHSYMLNKNDTADFFRALNVYTQELNITTDTESKTENNWDRLLVWRAHVSCAYSWWRFHRRQTGQHAGTTSQHSPPYHLCNVLTHWCHHHCWPDSSQRGFRSRSTNTGHFGEEKTQTNKKHRNEISQATEMQKKLVSAKTHT